MELSGPLSSTRGTENLPAKVNEGHLKISFFYHSLPDHTVGPKLAALNATVPCEIGTEPAYGSRLSCDDSSDGQDGHLSACTSPMSDASAPIDSSVPLPGAAVTSRSRAPQRKHRAPSIVPLLASDASRRSPVEGRV
jgi:hypothetical protein